MFSSYSELKKELNNNDTTCVDVVNNYIAKIEEKKHLNAFLEVFEESALAQAKLVDKKLANKTAGKLAGFVIGIKDNICYKGHKVSSASKILEGFESLYSSTAVERLLAEDAIIIGRLNCDEFAMGSSNENSSKGNVLNPIQEDRVPGGSSGGSAAAVAAGLCIATLGSDTGGSIRQPASFCGVVGFKPTYGRISRWGLLAYASSFDQIGPFTTNIEDAALLTQVMAGKDEFDSTVSEIEVDNYIDSLSLDKKLKIGIPKQVIESEGLNPEIKNSIINLIEKLKEKGHEVGEFDFPYLDYMVPTYYVLTTAEASSNYSRYDGVHFGYRSPNANDIESTYVLSRTEGFGEEVKRRIMLGTFVLSSGYYDAYYTKAMKVRRLIQNKTIEVFNDFDMVLGPTTPDTAFKIGENVKDPITMYLQDIFTVHANLSGNPAISLPLGQHSNGMPFGVQVMAKPFAEKELLAFSQELMKG
ncbi:Asp-tRNA(Asn)/Glu-tRNA(Gln) amidotransferase subunit GatA [Flavobacteriales bacterium]|nr:Asp-tRNA(Asn)/Glu-tRNA(Gln) amidotransferase subunit GatA [Flavobacteriales bacterium]